MKIALRVGSTKVARRKRIGALFPGPHNLYIGAGFVKYNIASRSDLLLARRAENRC
jgi:hypothetical protein